MLVTKNLSYTIGQHTILDGVDFSLTPGAVTVLIGPNGAGKSSLLSLLTQDASPTSGEIFFDNQPLEQYRLKDLAKKRAVMLQEHHVFFPFTVQQVVEMGRLPWLDLSTMEEDAAIVEEMLGLADIRHLRHQSVNRISGGEKARTSFARILAQHTDIIMLDEPVAALDLKHQEEVMKTVRTFTRNGGSALVVLHDLNLAAHYADEIVLLDGGTIVAEGAPREVLTAENILRSYGQSVDILDHPNGNDFLIVPKR